MNLIEICIAFIVAIVSIGTPLVFQVISKFDEKYHSDKIIVLFKRESRFNLLKAVLIASPISVFLYIVDSIMVLNTNVIIYSKLLIVLSYFVFTITIFLLVQFIFFSFVVLKYSIPSSFINSRINNLKKTSGKKRIEKEDNLSVVANFFLYSIQKGLTDTFVLIPDYMYQVFSNYRERFKNNLPEFPAIYYETTHLIAQELAFSKSKRLERLENYASGFNWLVGAADSSKISKKTYDVLWYNLRLLVQNRKDEMILKYWKQAVNHIEYNLRIPESNYPITSVESADKKGIKDAISERASFIDFQYYLGGFLFFKKRIKCIRKIWDQTNSEPPRYPLLPSTMKEIFDRYFSLCKVYDTELWQNAARFNFPKNDSVNFDWIVNSSIKKYLILLFLRQYTLHKYYIYQDFLSLPKSPELQSETKHWIENIGHFKDELKKIMLDEVLMKDLRFELISMENCKKDDKIFPEAWIDNFEQQLKKDFESKKINQSISSKKEREFLFNSKTTIENVLKEYGQILKDEKQLLKEVEYTTFNINGMSYILPKSDFAENQGYDSLNANSILAESLSNEIRRIISETFLWVATKSYRFEEINLFPAIDRLLMNENPDQFVIISFRNNMEYYRNVLKVPELNSDNYKKIVLFDIWNCNTNMVGNTVFILKKTELPSLNFDDPTNKKKINYKEEEKILKDVYASIIDLHEKRETKEQLIKEGVTEDLDDKVLISIEMNAAIRWKKNVKVIAFKVISEYQDDGLPNKIEEVTQFGETLF